MVCFALVGLPWSVTGSCPSLAMVFESTAPLTFSIVGHHSLPCFMCLINPFFTCPVRIPSHPFHLFHSLQRVLLGCGVSGVFGLFCLFFWFGLFVCLLGCLRLFVS